MQVVGVSAISKDTRGKHRIMVELNKLDQETRFLQLNVATDLEMGINRIDFKQELESLEKLEKASHVCQELVHNVECNADPLLPVTTGPSNASWDRWFEGPQDTKGCGSCGCWML